MSKNLTPKNIAFVYNVRHSYPDPKNPATFTETDFDDQESIDKMSLHLKNIGFNIFPIEANMEAESKLAEIKDKIDVAFNYSEVVVGSAPKIYMAKIYEKLGIPFSGSSNLTQETIIDKGKMKKVLQTKGVSTLPFYSTDDSSADLASGFNFPVIVKPIAEGSSAGITNNSVVNNNEELHRQVKFVKDTFGEESIVEPFIEGREFSVGMLGNPPEFLPIIEPMHEKLPEGYYSIDSLEVKWEFEEELGKDYFSCPAKVDTDLEKEIHRLCLETWEALKIRDFCRIDLRMDSSGKVYVLDVNSPPGLIPPEITETSYFPMAAKIKGIEYEDLLKRIITAAYERTF